MRRGCRSATTMRSETSFEKFAEPNAVPVRRNTRLPLGLSSGFEVMDDKAHRRLVGRHRGLSGRMPVERISSSHTVGSGLARAA